MDTDKLFEANVWDLVLFLSSIQKQDYLSLQARSVYFHNSFLTLSSLRSFFGSNLFITSYSESLQIKVFMFKDFCIFSLFFFSVAVINANFAFHVCRLPSVALPLIWTLEMTAGKQQSKLKTIILLSIKPYTLLDNIDQARLFTHSIARCPPVINHCAADKWQGNHLDN